MKIDITTHTWNGEKKLGYNTNGSEYEVTSEELKELQESTLDEVDKILRKIVAFGQEIYL